MDTRRKHFDTPSELLACYYAKKSGLTWYDACQLMGFSNSHFSFEKIEKYFNGMNPTREMMRNYLKQNHGRCPERGEIFDLDAPILEKKESTLDGLLRVLTELDKMGYKLIQK